MPPRPADLLGRGPALLERALGYTRGCLVLVADANPHAATPCARWDLAGLLAHMDDSLAAFTEAAELGRVALPGTGPTRSPGREGEAAGTRSPGCEAAGTPTTSPGGAEPGPAAGPVAGPAERPDAAPAAGRAERPDAAPAAGPVAADVDGVGATLLSLRRRACALLAAWSVDAVPPVRIGARTLDPDLLAAVGSLEIAVHGWDVSAACGTPRPIPEALAEVLLAVADLLLDDGDEDRFAQAVDVPEGADAGTRLLARLGRTA